MNGRKVSAGTTVGLILATIFALVAVASPMARADASRFSPASLSARGWTCVDVVLLDDTDLGVHCFPPGFMSHDASIAVLYFGTSDPDSTDAPFLGTEILIRADLYAGQPCPSEGLAPYMDLLPLLEIPYFACHFPVGGP